MSAHSMPGTMVVACILSWVCVFPDVAVGGSRYLSEASRAMKEEALQYAEDYVTEKIEAALSIPSLPDIQELKDKAAAEVDSAKESALAWQAEVEGKARERFEEAMQRAQDTDLISYPWMCTFEKTLVLNDNLNALAEAAKQAGVNFALISQYSKQAQCGANLLDKMVGKVDSFTESISDLASTVDDAADILKYIPKYGGTIKKVLETVSRIAEKLVKAANKAVQVPVTLLAYVQKGLEKMLAADSAVAGLDTISATVHEWANVLGVQMLCLDDLGCQEFDGGLLEKFSEFVNGLEVCYVCGDNDSYECDNADKKRVSMSCNGAPQKFGFITGSTDTIEGLNTWMANVGNAVNKFILGNKHLIDLTDEEKEEFFGSETKVVEVCESSGNCDEFLMCEPNYEERDDGDGEDEDADADEDPSEIDNPNALLGGTGAAGFSSCPQLSTSSTIGCSTDVTLNDAEPSCLSSHAPSSCRRRRRRSSTTASVASGSTRRRSSLSRRRYTSSRRRTSSTTCDVAAVDICADAMRTVEEISLEADLPSGSFSETDAELRVENFYAKAQDFYNVHPCPEIGATIGAMMDAEDEDEAAMGESDETSWMVGGYRGIDALMTEVQPVIDWVNEKIQTLVDALKDAMGSFSCCAPELLGDFTSLLAEKMTQFIDLASCPASGLLTGFLEVVENKVQPLLLRAFSRIVSTDSLKDLLGSKIEFTEYTLKFLTADTERTQAEREKHFADVVLAEWKSRFPVVYQPWGDEPWKAYSGRSGGIEVPACEKYGGQYSGRTGCFPGGIFVHLTPPSRDVEHMCFGDAALGEIGGAYTAGTGYPTSDDWDWAAGNTFDHGTLEHCEWAMQKLQLMPGEHSTADNNDEYNLNSGWEPNYPGQVRETPGFLRKFRPKGCYYEVSASNTGMWFNAYEVGMSSYDTYEGKPNEDVTSRDEQRQTLEFFVYRKPCLIIFTEVDESQYTTWYSRDGVTPSLDGKSYLANANPTCDFSSKDLAALGRQLGAGDVDTAFDTMKDLLLEKVRDHSYSVGDALDAFVTEVGFTSEESTDSVFGSLMGGVVDACSSAWEAFAGEAWELPDRDPCCNAQDGTILNPFATEAGADWYCESKNLAKCSGYVTSKYCGQLVDAPGVFDVLSTDSSKFCATSGLIRGKKGSGESITGINRCTAGDSECKATGETVCESGSASRSCFSMYSGWDCDPHPNWKVWKDTCRETYEEICIKYYYCD